MTPITDAAVTLAGMLAEADMEGIPAPFDVTATGYRIDLMVATLDDLSVWAQWFDAPIDDSTKHSGATHYRTEGSRDDIPVIRVITVVTEGAEVSA